MPGWALSDVRPVRFHLLIDLLADIHQARDLRAPREIILVLYRLRLEASYELLRIVVRPTGHPTRRFHRPRQGVMIGILFVPLTGIMRTKGYGFLNVCLIRLRLLTASASCYFSVTKRLSWRGRRDSNPRPHA